MQYDSDTIVELIKQFKDGDTEAFNGIYEGTYRLVYNACYGVLGNEDDAQDITQDTFIQIYKKLDTLQDPQAYAKWMKLTATRLSLNHIRQTGRVETVEDDAFFDVMDNDWSEFNSLPDSFIEEEEQRQIFDDILRKSLSEVQYQTVFMHFFDEMNVEQIAEAMNCPSGTVKTRLMHAKAKIRKPLEKYFDPNKAVFAAVPFLTRFFASNPVKVSIPPIVDLGIPELTGTAGTAGAGAGSSVLGSSTGAAVGKSALGNIGTKGAAKNIVSSPVSNPGANTAANAGKVAGAKGGFLSTVAGKVVVGAAAVAVVGTAVTVAVIANKKYEPKESSVVTDYGSDTQSSDGSVTTSNIGSQIKMGYYADSDLEWIVLDENDSEVLLLSKYIIEHKRYNDEAAVITWEDCSLRRWLNGEFYATAFSDSEKNDIRVTTVVNSDDPANGNPGGNDTEDRVFLLSLEEADKYFVDFEARLAKATEHAIANGVLDSAGNSAWWLRSPAAISGNAAVVYNSGTMEDHGSGVDHDLIGVRPAMWVSKDRLTNTDSSDETARETHLYVDASKGSIVTFGKYSGEDISWMVIDESDDKVLLLTKDVIESKEYNPDFSNTTWENCYLRHWLNEEFYMTSFSDGEKEHICLTQVGNSDDPQKGTPGGGDTEDRVFLLSDTEAKKYFATDDSRKANATKHAADNDVYKYKGFAAWWLRSPGSNDNFADSVFSDGSLISDSVYYDRNGVRPAMWVSKGDLVVNDNSTPVNINVYPSRIVTFGKYCDEDIDWIVLDMNDNGIMLMSKRILEGKKFNDKKGNVTWEECSLRNWLNGEFFNTAFNDSERSHIQMTQVGNSGGNVTNDYVYLLSVDEVKSLISSENLRWAQATRHARSNGVLSAGDDDGMCEWWLRTSGKGKAAFVDAVGYPYAGGIAVNHDHYGVRPVIWVTRDAFEIG